MSPFSLSLFPSSFSLLPSLDIQTSLSLSHGASRNANRAKIGKCSGFNHDDKWGHRAGEPNKAVICSLALARLRSDIRGNEMGSNAVGMAQKLLLFWRKPARRCWWEGVELEGVEGLPEGTRLKVWIRRVWTLEMSVIGLR